MNHRYRRPVANVQVVIRSRPCRSLGSYCQKSWLKPLGCPSAVRSNDWLGNETSGSQWVPSLVSTVDVEAQSAKLR